MKLHENIYVSLKSFVISNIDKKFLCIYDMRFDAYKHVDVISITASKSNIIDCFHIQNNNMHTTVEEVECIINTIKRNYKIEKLLDI